MILSSSGAWLFTASLNLPSKIFNSSSISFTGIGIDCKTGNLHHKKEFALVEKSALRVDVTGSIYKNGQIIPQKISKSDAAKAIILVTK
jgi:hypothetical protein